MYKISSKPIEWVEEESFFELQLKNQTYNNGVYSFTFIVKGANSYLITDEDHKEYTKVFEELFPNTHIEPVLTATIKFDVNENDIIVSDTLSFNMNKLQRYSIEVIDVQLYKSDVHTKEISEVINKENVTSILMGHSKSKEILSYLKNEEETFYNLMPGYGSDDVFPSYSYHGGFEFEKE